MPPNEPKNHCNQSFLKTALLYTPHTVPTEGLSEPGEQQDTENRTVLSLACLHFPTKIT